MADTLLVLNYLREARKLHPSSIPAQLEYLEKLRAAAFDLVKAGDFAVTGQTMEGGGTQATRGISDRQQLDAITAAMERLENESGITTYADRRSCMLSFRIAANA